MTELTSTCVRRETQYCEKTAEQMVIFGFRVTITGGQQESLNVRLMDGRRESADWWSHPSRPER